MMSASDHAALSSLRRNSVEPCLKDALNLTDLRVSPVYQTSKSLIFSAKSGYSELSSSELKNTFELSPAEQTDDIKSTERFNAEQIL